MADKAIKKVTSDELIKFNSFINKRKEILTTLGSAELQLRNLKLQKDQFFESLQKIDVLESEFHQELATKYGKVSVDVTTGEITA